MNTLASPSARHSPTYNVQVYFCKIFEHNETNIVTEYGTVTTMLDMESIFERMIEVHANKYDFLSLGQAHEGTVQTVRTVHQNIVVISFVKVRCQFFSIYKNLYIRSE